MSSDKLLDMENITQVFKTRRGQVRAAESVSLSIGAGEVVCLVGQSGSGKSTMAKIGSGLLAPSNGTVRFEGVDIYDKKARSRRDWGRFRRSVQYVHQDPYSSLNPIHDVYSILTAPLLKHKVAKGHTEARKRASELLEQVDLRPADTFLKKFPHQLSGGQRQRVSVARALTLNPTVIFADEATSMLDVSIRISLLEMLTRLRTELGVGFLFITHDLAMAKYFGAEGEMAVMHHGRVVERGPTLDVIDNPTDDYTKALLEAVPEADPDLARRKREARAAAKEATVA